MKDWWCKKQGNKVQYIVYVKVRFGRILQFTLLNLQNLTLTYSTLFPCFLHHQSYLHVPPVTFFIEKILTCLIVDLFTCSTIFIFLCQKCSNTLHIQLGNREFPQIMNCPCLSYFEAFNHQLTIVHVTCMKRLFIWNENATI